MSAPLRAARLTGRLTGRGKERQEPAAAERIVPPDAGA
jgi:hypothetical protein